MVVKGNNTECYVCKRYIYSLDGPKEYWHISKWNVSLYRESMANRVEDIHISQFALCDSCCKELGFKDRINKIIVIGEI